MDERQDSPTSVDTEPVDLKSRDTVIREYMWLVRCIARSIAEKLPPSVVVEDLISVGTMGLIKAVDDFDDTRGAKLETYARYRIRGAVLDELRKQDVLPYSTRSKLRQLERAIDGLERELGRYPSDDEITQKTGLAPEEVSRLLATASNLDLYSLDELFECGECDVSIDAACAPSAPRDPLSKLEREELVQIVVEGIRHLPRMEKTVLGLYYYEGLRMKEIAEVFGITESRVSQIHSKAILLLRGKLRSHMVR